ncbi:LacI family DNA-binding transcriptional regulator [Allokutzneria sp. NRRL B-24872]|uniref:LacI family DNA-binding transcriptional regulator n=1 Tax=Allokutzneria sp. NRRL B-24872 TaxID=1137961 RepID=UPI00143D98A5|nr:LacI family DNA-binding transcriptional regulator [Allokutzneria sp. NRRL B-24872]
MAREAGVSQTTVSLILRGADSGRVSPATVRRVREAAEALGYRPNEAGRSLRGVPSRLIGLVVQDATDPYFAMVLRGAADSAWSSRHMIGLVEGRGVDGLSEVVDAVLGTWMSGVIVCAPTPDELAVLAPIADRVAVLEHPARAPCTVTAVVDYDVRAGMAEAVGHLHSLGHTRVGHVRAEGNATTFVERRIAVRARYRGPELVVPQPFDTPVSTERITEFLRSNADLTAIVCDTDVLAAKVYVAAQRCSIPVPQRLSVVGFNDSPLTTALEPALTSVALPAERAGHLLARSLIDPGHRRPHELLVPTLTVRASTARNADG